MKIYTKQGDKGKTSLLGGQIVSKSHIRIEAYGTLDELISYIGLLRDTIKNSIIEKLLILIQDKLMVISSILASDNQGQIEKLPAVSDSDIQFLEKEIDAMEKELPPLKSFILPGGHIAVSYCHIVRSISRRAERKIIELHEESVISEIILKYINRLSDFFFVLARKISNDNHVNEIPWTPSL